MEKRRVLIIRTGGLGDSLLLWPGLAAVRAQDPQASIDLLGNQERLELMAVPGGADRALSVEGSGLHQLLAFEAEPDEAVGQWFAAYRTVVAFAAQGDYALGENLAACGVAEVHVFLPFPSQHQGGHVADYCLTCLQAASLAGTDPDPPPLLPVTPAESAAAQAHLADSGVDPRRLALLLPGSGSAAKSWPAERFSALAEALAGEGLNPVLVRGPADSGAVDAVQTAVGQPLVVLADADPSLLKGLVGLADLVVGNDAGPSHLAALVGTPTVAVFGPSDPERWRPLGPRVELVQSEDLDLSGVSVDRVAAACRRLRET